MPEAENITRGMRLVDGADTLEIHAIRRLREGLASEGECDRRVTVEQSTRTADGQGGATLSWATYGTFWAAKDDLDGRERFYAGSVVPGTTIRYRIRGNPWVELLCGEQ